MTTREVVAWIVVGILIAFGGYMTYKSVSANGRVKTLAVELIACQNAPVTIRDSIRDTIIYTDRWHTPKTIPYAVYIDTVKPIWCKQYYADTVNVFKGSLRGSFCYEISVIDCQATIRFPQINFPILERTITKTVLQDTCIKVKQPLFRWGPYAGLTLNSFSKFPGIEVGAQLIIKDQVTISGGGLILNGIYGNIRLGWLFKK